MDKDRRSTTNNKMAHSLAVQPTRNEKQSTKYKTSDFGSSSDLTQSNDSKKELQVLGKYQTKQNQNHFKAIRDTKVNNAYDD